MKSCTAERPLKKKFEKSADKSDFKVMPSSKIILQILEDQKQ